ncbi:MAG: hypothetical protein COB09_08280 [Thalassobium sp.]|nr:MAG: hypothetical protein COB09_08280 [Thalassobium sp.]
MSFGERVKQRRKMLKLTQKDLAARVGISRSAVASWEMGDHIPGGDPAMKLPGALECSWSWLTTGKGSAPAASGSGVHFEPQKDQPIPLLEKPHIGSFVSGEHGSFKESAGPKSALIRDAAGAGPRTFAYVETSDGMSPRIEPGDTVYIDPDQSECKPGREIWLFRVGNGYALGTVTETPRGLMLRFDNQAPGWEPMPVQPADCAGKLVAFVPSWLN